MNPPGNRKSQPGNPPPKGGAPAFDPTGVYGEGKVIALQLRAIRKNLYLFTDCNESFFVIYLL